jgi:hypothetical protein
MLMAMEDRAARHRRIAERYARGDPLKQIACEEGVDRKTVRNVARRANLPLRHPPRTERNARIVRRYEKGEPVVQIARSEGVRSSYVSHLARKAGLPARPSNQRRYPINERVFDEPDAVGWWLIGLLAADGSVSSRGCVSLSQRQADIDVLHAFLSYVGSPDRPLTELRHRNGLPAWSRAGSRYFEARVFSRAICDALARHGIVPRKSKTLVLSKTAAKEPAVWLGLLDGDGCAGLKYHHGTPRIDFFGTRAVMEQCAGFWHPRLSLQTGRAPTVHRHAGGLSVVRIYGSNAARAAGIMLQACPVSLARKRRVLEAIARYVAVPSRFGERLAIERGEQNGSD